MLCGKWRNSRYQFLQFGLIWWGYSTHNLLHLRRACWPLLHINGHSWLITVFPTRLIQWVSLMEQELSNLPLHPSSPPVFIGVRVTQSLPLCVCFVDRFFSPFVIFILTIMLSVLLRFMDSDYPLGILKLFFVQYENLTLDFMMIFRERQEREYNLTFYLWAVIHIFILLLYLSLMSTRKVSKEVTSPTKYSL